VAGSREYLRELSSEWSLPSSVRNMIFGIWSRDGKLHDECAILAPEKHYLTLRGQDQGNFRTAAGSVPKNHCHGAAINRNIEGYAQIL
jgi:hypothetical protein